MASSLDILINILRLDTTMGAGNSCLATDQPKKHMIEEFGFYLPNHNYLAGCMRYCLGSNCWVK